MNTPTLCLLIGGTKEEKNAYTELLNRVTDVVLAESDNKNKILSAFDNERYVVVDSKGSENKFIEMAKFYGAEVVGVFFNYMPKSTVGFDRVILH